MPNTPDKTSVARFYWQHVTKYPRLAIGALTVIPITVFLNGYFPPLILAGVLNRLATEHIAPHDWWHVFGTRIIAYAAMLLIGMAMWRIVDFFAWRLEM